MGIHSGLIQIYSSPYSSTKTWAPDPLLSFSFTLNSLTLQPPPQPHHLRRPPFHPDHHPNKGASNAYLLKRSPTSRSLLVMCPRPII